MIVPMEASPSLGVILAAVFLNGLVVGLIALLMLPNWRRRMFYGFDFNIRTNAPFGGVMMVRSLIPTIIAASFVVTGFDLTLLGGDPARGSIAGDVGVGGVLVGLGWFLPAITAAWFGWPKFLIPPRYRQLKASRDAVYNGALLPPPPPPGMYRRQPGFRPRGYSDAGQPLGKHEATGPDDGNQPPAQ